MNRRRFPIFAILLAAPLLARADESEWPQWRGPNRDNVWPVHRLPAKLPDRLAVRWQTPIGGGYGGIAVRNLRAYVMDRLKEPNDVERVVCLNLDTGAIVWVHEYRVSYQGIDYGNGPRSTPTIHDDRVYTLGAAGHLHCLDAVTGTVIWRRDCVREFGAKLPSWGLACSPLIDDDRVVVQVGGDNACAIAFDRLTGEVRWKALPDRVGYTSPVRLDIGKNRLLIVWTAENITALDAATGKLRWAVPFAITYDVAIADPVWHDGVLLCSQYWEGSLALRLGPDGVDPQTAWEGKRLRLLMATALVRDGHAYGLDREHGLTCVELKSGVVKWKGYMLSADKRNPHAAPAWTADGRAVFLGDKGELSVARLSPDGYDELTRTKIFEGSWAHPALLGDRILVRDDKEIRCVNLPER